MDIPGIKELAGEVVAESKDEFKSLVENWIKQGIKEHLTSHWSSPFVSSFRTVADMVFTDEYKRQLADAILAEFEAYKPQLMELSRQCMQAHIITLHEGLLAEFLDIMGSHYDREQFFRKLFKKGS